MSSDKHDIDEILAEMHSQLLSYLKKSNISEPLIIGIQTGGLWIAEKMRSSLNIGSPVGELNIAFYRDDFSRIGLHPRVTPSSLPFEIEDRHIILVDDVLHTGRTIRAAMNEIFDYGRPASITLAVLIDRSGRELPIQADVVGKRLALKTDEHVKLLGPEPLALEFK
ncbi:MAG: bifunctional pyr operon transcriptional regulator/uracil phosphoribosyltransferase PyrR [Gammaproteobacteria bacterium]|jgi:pyrimidine operon attenuation protein/uracil phosphoribosyltransferase|nr:bifunctional pyr operon transcriptional regulator/uracil phosphoribosyltransferase PyrR [Gammaproteobacteria bacterium]